MSTKNVGILLGVITIEKEREKRERGIYIWNFFTYVVLFVCIHETHVPFVSVCVCVLARGPHMGGGSARMTMRLWKVVVA